MTPLPGALGSGDVVAWRLDHGRFAATWDSGEGAFRVGGRWNSRGVRAVYASLDPATAILEVAVHKGFRALDTVPHMLTGFEVRDVSDIRIVAAEQIPNGNWLRPGIPSAGQQKFGDALLADAVFTFVPSVVSNRSWNLLFDPIRAAGRYRLREQESFALDTRLHPPA